MKKTRIVNLFAGLALGVSIMTPVQAIPYTERHTFSINDVQGDFAGSTFGGTTTSDGTIPPDNSILCDAPGAVSCPAGVAKIVDKKLYGQNAPLDLFPVDSRFGYDSIDFLGAAQKTRDNDYAEGFVGDVPPAYFPTSANIDGVDIPFNEDPVTGKYPPILGGVAVSNAATDTYKVKPPMGTWCRGLGGNSVKCETEHYSVMEHILSCHEVIPYFFADPLTGIQAILNEGSAEIPTLDEYNCADAGLDDIALVVTDGLVGGMTGDDRLVDGTPCEAVNDPVGCQLFPNDKTDVNNNVALSTDYSVQLKDDGKALYGWGAIHKRPNDVRLYASLELPAEWKVEGANYTINSAKLVVRHHITNNPNDQVRPEDLENEAAIGRKPSYRVEGTIGESDEVWKSTKSCFEGDGDFIDNDEGSSDPDIVTTETLFKNTQFAITNYPPLDPEDPYPFSSDLTGAFTNAWYTTIDRDPFEWSYDDNPDPTIQNFVGSWLENPALGELVSGPRWRLKPNKYGQDLPGLEVAVDAEPGQGTDGADCYAPPFEKALIKYEVGVPTITEINLLDWDEDEGPSPLATSSGWVDVTQNGFVTVAGTSGGVPYTTNGLPMSDNFDLAVYVKGDRKPTAVYDAYLEIDYEAPTAVVPDVGECPTVVAATAIIEGVDSLTVNPVNETESSVACEPGLVLNTIPAAGTPVAEGSEITLVVATEPVILSDVSIRRLSVPATINTGATDKVSVVITNDPAAAESGPLTVTITGTDGSAFTADWPNLLPGARKRFEFGWTAPLQATTVNWTATVTISGVDVDTAGASTLVQ